MTKLELIKKIVLITGAAYAETSIRDAVDAYSSALIAAKPPVVGSFIVPADYDEGQECDDDGCYFCGDPHCGESCRDDDW